MVFHHLDCFFTRDALCHASPYFSRIWTEHHNAIDTSITLNWLFTHKRIDLRGPITWVEISTISTISNPVNTNNIGLAIRDISKQSAMKKPVFLEWSRCNALLMLEHLVSWSVIKNDDGEEELRCFHQGTEINDDNWHPKQTKYELLNIGEGATEWRFWKLMVGRVCKQMEGKGLKYFRIVRRNPETSNRPTVPWIDPC